jgi:hypothetical protein
VRGEGAFYSRQERLPLYSSRMAMADGLSDFKSGISSKPRCKLEWASFCVKIDRLRPKYGCFKASFLDFSICYRGPTLKLKCPELILKSKSAGLKSALSRLRVFR